MPRTTKKTTSKKKPQTKTAFVLALPKSLSAAQVIAKAKAAGFKLTEGYVYTIRSAARTANAGKTKSAVTKATQAVTKASSTRSHRSPTPGKVGAAPRTLADVAPLDLAYAVGRLVARGVTTAAEVMQFAAERSSRISSLEADLAALKAGALPVSALPPKTTKKTKRSKKVGKAPAPKAIRKAQPMPAKAPPAKTIETAQPTPPKAPPPKTIKKVVPKPKKKAPPKKGEVTTRKDGRSFTMTPKALAARKMQGSYLGFLRQVPAKEKASFKGIAQEKGVAAAVDALKKRLGKK